MNGKANRLAQAGAVMYVLWGILHIVVGAIPLISLLNQGPAAMFSFYNLEIDPAAVDAQWQHAANLVAEHAVELIAFGIMAIIVALALNWKNDPLGFWLNFIVLGLVDLAFVLGEMVPGTVPVGQTIIGPALYVLGVVLTGAGLLSARRSEQPQLAGAGG